MTEGLAVAEVLSEESPFSVELIVNNSSSITMEELYCAFDPRKMGHLRPSGTSRWVRDPVIVSTSLVDRLRVLGIGSNPKSRFCTIIVRFRGSGDWSSCIIWLCSRRSEASKISGV